MASHSLAYYFTAVCAKNKCTRGLIRDPKVSSYFSGNDSVAYRDPAVLFHDNTFHLFYTVERSENGLIYFYTANSQSQDLKSWSPTKIITPKNQNLNFSSPGNVIQYKDEWILSLQTYPRPGLGRLDCFRPRGLGLGQRKNYCGYSN